MQPFRTSFPVVLARWRVLSGSCLWPRDNLATVNLAQMLSKHLLGFEHPCPDTQGGCISQNELGHAAVTNSSRLQTLSSCESQGALLQAGLTQEPGLTRLAVSTTNKVANRVA